MAKKKSSPSKDFSKDLANQLKDLFSSISFKLDKDKIKKKSAAGSGFISKFSNSIISMLSEYSVQQEEVVGIDITPNSLKLAQLSKKEEEWTVEKLAFRHLDRIEDVKSSAVKISEEIETAFKSGKFTTTNAAVSLPVSSSIVKVITMPLMTDEEMLKAIEYDSLWENLTQLPDAVEEYSIFHQTIRKDSAQNLMDVLFVASKLSDVNQYIDIVKKAQMNPIVMDVRCFALRNAFETKNMKEMTKAPLAILEMGAHENYLLILKDEVPFVSDIFVSSKDKETLGTDHKDQKSISAIIDRFAMQIKQNLDSYSSRFKSEKVQNLFIVSNSPNVNEITTAFSKKFKDMAVMVLDPFNSMVVPQQIKEKLDAESNNSSYTAVAGLATRKLDIFGYYQKVTGVNNINLLPNREGVRKSQRTKFISGFALVAVIAILIISSSLIGYNYFSKSSENTQDLVDYSQVESQLSELQLKMMKLKNENKNLIEGLKLSETATTNQDTAAKVLVSLAEKAGLNIALATIIFDGNVQYKIEGEALSDSDVINYLSRIREIEIFDSVVLEKSFLATEGSNIKSFHINIDVKSEFMSRKNLERNMEAVE
tara:strand:+ start:371 stop:2155 length:1785 start_codon:yes stop_codon:yes gene_type:complete